MRKAELGGAWILFRISGNSMCKLSVYTLSVFLMSGIACAQEQSILDIFDQFAAANSAAGYCVRPDGAKLNHFVANFQVISTNAAVELKQRNPTTSGEGISKMLQDRYAQIDGIVDQVIQDEGCEGPKVQETLRQFRTLANMDVYDLGKKKRPPSH